MMPTAGQNRQGPIFVGGPERSGKTYMRMMLEEHPNIIFSRRTNMWTTYYGRFGSLSSEENLDRCLNAMMERPLISSLDPDLKEIRRRFKEGPQTYGRLFALFHEQLADLAGKPRWGDQTGLIERCADAIFAAFPQAKMIQMIRDPRDRFEALCTRNSHQRNRLGQATAKWLYSEAFARQNLQAYPERYMVVRYESMVSQPAETMAAVCQFLGETFTSSMLTMASESRFQQDTSPSAKANESPLSTAFIGRYRQGLSKMELAFIQGQTDRLLGRYDYISQPLRFSTPEKIRYVLTTWGPNVMQMNVWRALHSFRIWKRSQSANQAPLGGRQPVGMID